LRFSISKNSKNGRRKHPNCINGQPLEYISFTSSRKEAIIEKVAPLYERGLSLKQIAQETKIPKTSVRDALIAGGVSLRPHTSLAARLPAKARQMRIGVAPYGFCWFQGRLVADPKEMEIVQLIIRLWQEEQTYSAITRHLNELRKRTRCGGKWDHSLVRNIILRHQKNPNQLKEALSWDSTNFSR
jgi:hypothetical protein